MELAGVILRIVLWVLGGIGLFVFVYKTFRRSYVTVQQQTVGIITRFGKFLKIAPAGLNWKIPYFDQLDREISLQNRSQEVKFQAITTDQANVFFNALLLYGVSDSSDATIQKVAFKFRSEQEFQSSLLRTVEGEVRAFVAGKKQSEMLTLRSEIVEHVKDKLDVTLAEWGFHLQNVQINDITFDKVIMDSMAQVVASSNLKAAAENEGQALLIKKTKAAEAEGNAIKIQAEAEKQAATSRGQGIASFREEVAKGMKTAQETIGNGDDAMNAILFSMWVECMKEISRDGKSNQVLFFDGSASGMASTMKQIQGLNLLEKH